MGMAHHGDSQDSELIRQLREEQDRLLKRHRAQQDGSANRQWTDGRLSGDDDGEIAVKIGSDTEKQIVVLDFGKPVTWAAMPPQQAVELAQMLIKHARQISAEPLKIVLH